MSGASRPDPAAPLLLARDVTLYLLSLLSVASARIAWLPAGGLALASQALLLTLAACGGTLLAEVASGAWTSASRRRNRLLLLGGYAGLAFFALVAATAGGEIVGKEAEAFGFLQSGLLLIAPLLGLEVAVLANALLLVVLASLRGGAPAAVAATGFIGLVAYFLAFDHAGRKLQAWPAARGHLLGPVARDTARLVAPVVVGLVLVFSIAPPTPHARGSAAHAALRSQENRGAYRWLGLLALGGGGLMVLLGRLLRSRGGEDAPLLERIEPHQGIEEPLEPPRPDEGAYGGPEARVIRAYVRFLTRAREAGWKLPRHQTPREVEARVREPEGPLALLTALFMDARYGPGEPAVQDVRDAENASQTLVAALGRRRSGRGGPGRA